AAPAGGLTATLSTDNSQVVTLPNPTLVIPGGANMTTFTVTTAAVNVQTTVNISAVVALTASPSQNSSGSVPLKVDPTTASQVQSITLGPRLPSKARRPW